MVQKKPNIIKYQIISPICNVYSYPNCNGPLETQLLLGEPIEVISDIYNEWVKCISIKDNY